MAVKCTTKEELAQAIKNNEKDIFICDAKLKDGSLTIITTGKIAWAIAIAAIGVAVASFFMAPGPGAVSAAALTAGSAGILGLSASGVAIGVAIAAGGVGVLNSLRDYKVVENNDKYLHIRK